MWECSNWFSSEPCPSSENPPAYVLGNEGCVWHGTRDNQMNRGEHGAGDETQSTAGRRVGERRLNQFLALIMESAADALGFDGATTTVRDGDDLATVATTGQRFVGLDAAQYGSGEGPCLQALEGGEAVVWNAEDDQQAWRAFQEAAAKLGIATSLSVPLPIDDTTEIAASLNLYAEQRDEVTEQQLQQANQFAAQLAAALQMIDATKATAKIARETAGAMRAAAAIEQARGVLMAQSNITPDQAFEQLVEMAQLEERTLQETAAKVIAEGTGPASED